MLSHQLLCIPKSNSCSKWGQKAVGMPQLEITTKHIGPACCYMHGSFPPHTEK